MLPHFEDTTSPSSPSHSSDKSKLLILFFLAGLPGQPDSELKSDINCKDKREIEGSMFALMSIFDPCDQWKISLNILLQSLNRRQFYFLHIKY